MPWYNVYITAYVCFPRDQLFCNYCHIFTGPHPQIYIYIFVYIYIYIYTRDQHNRVPHNWLILIRQLLLASIF